MKLFVGMFQIVLVKIMMTKVLAFQDGLMFFLFLNTKEQILSFFLSYFKWSTTKFS